MEKETMQVVYTTGKNKDFAYMASLLDAYYYERFGEEALAYKKFNHAESVDDVVLIYIDGKPAAAGGLRAYDEKTTELKRVLVLKEFRRRGLAGEVTGRLEKLAKEKGYTKIILETAKPMEDAIAFYKSIGYSKTENYGDYIGDDLCVCMSKEL